MTDNLSPCPFCGSEGYFSQPVVGSKWFEVSCSGDDCGAMGPSLPDKAEALAAWNRRADPPKDRAVVSAGGDTVERSGG